MANCWKDWGMRYGYFASKQDADIFYDEIVYTHYRGTGSASKLTAMVQYPACIHRITLPGSHRGTIM